MLKAKKTRGAAFGLCGLPYYIWKGTRRYDKPPRLRGEERERDMKNAKRMLSLLAALILLFGLLSPAVSARTAADYGDAAQIEHRDAVELLTALGIVQGTDKGTFNPSGAVTRAAMAKMICVTLSGGYDNPAAYLTGTPRFSDTRGHWAEGYIEFCAALGIAAGDGGGRFRPDNPVTGTQAAKMLLTALGYSAEREGLVGAGWELRTLILSYSAGLFDGLDESPGLTGSRDGAAQMVYNALMGGQTVIYAGSVRAETGKTLGQAKFSLVPVYGTVTRNEYGSIQTANSPSAAGTTVLTLENGAEFTVRASTGADLLGKAAVAYTRNGGGDALYGEPSALARNRAVTASAALTAAKLQALLRENGLALPDNTPLAVNCGGDSVSTVGSADAFSNAAGVETTFLDRDGDGRVDLVLQTKWYVGYVSSYSAWGEGSVGITRIGNWGASFTGTAAQTDGFADLNKGDYVLYYTVAGRCTVKPCASVSGTVTALKGNTVTLNGAVYAQSGLVSTVDGTSPLADAVELGKAWTLYTDRSGAVVAAEPVESREGCLMVLESNDGDAITALNPLRAVLLLADGSTVTAEISRLEGRAVSDANKTLAEGTRIYRYGVDGDGKYRLAEETDNFVAPGSVTAITKGSPTLVSGALYADSKTVFVVPVSSGGYRAYMGYADVPDLTGVSACALKNGGGVASLVFVTAGTPATVPGGSLFLLDPVPTRTLDGEGNLVYTYAALKNGEVTSVQTADGTLFGAVGLYENILLADGAAVSAGTYAAPSAVRYAGGGVVATDLGVYAWDGNTRLFRLDTETGEVTEGTADELSADGTDRICVITDAAGPTLARYILVVQ